jgi:hypothetical protein
MKVSVDVWHRTGHWFELSEMLNRHFGIGLATREQPVVISSQCRGDASAILFHFRWTLFLEDPFIENGQEEQSQER